ncbi:MAG: LON peptidase substrate-binding domain-containing protein, partial [Chthoniobacterales bacterium]
MSSSITLPKQLPVMPLPGAVLFPHALLPLYIFEPRYRKMLEHALQRHRM